MSLLALVLLRRLLRDRLAARAKASPTFVDDALPELVRRTRTYFFVAVALLIGMRALTLPGTARGWIGRALTLLVLMQVGRWVANLVGLWVHRYAQQRTLAGDASSVTTVRAMGYAVRALVWLILLITALETVFDYDVSALVTGLGIAGIAVALAVQTVLGDLLAALSIVVDKPFVVGDFIIVGDFLGTVEQIGLRTTRLRSLGGEQIIYSNAELLKSTIRNYKRMYERRAVLSFEVHLDTRREALAALPGALRTIVESQSPVRFDRAHVAGITDRSFRLEVVYHVLNPDMAVNMDVQERVILALLEHLERNDIRLARTLLEEKIVSP